MSDNTVAIKLIVILAVIILLANLMGVGAVSPFQGLQDAFSAGPSLPEFIDPFGLKEYVAFVAIPVANRSSSDYWPLAVNGHELYGYDLDEYYRNLESPDGEASYIRSPEGAGYGVLINEPPSMPSDVRISRVEIEIQARTAYANVTVWAWPVSVGGGTFIPAGSSFQNYSSTQFPEVVFSGWENLTSATIIVMDSNNTNAIVDISFIRFSIWVGGQPECSAPAGAWFPVVDELACQFAQGVDWFITALQFVVNALIFGFLYVGGWLVWAGTIIAAFVSGIVNMSLWFLDLEAPAVIQGFFGIMTVAVIGFFFLVIIQVVRG